MKSILGIGNAITDIPVVLPDGAIVEELGLSPGSMNHVDALLASKVMEKIRERCIGYIPGGSAANTVAAASMLGMKGRFVGKVGNDEMGGLYGKGLELDGVDTVLLKGSAHSGWGITFIVQPEGERTFVTYLGAALEFSQEELLPEMFEGYDYLHMEGYLMQCGNVVERALEIAMGRGMLISFDLGSCGIVRRYYDRLRWIVENCADIVFANGEEAEAFTGKRGEDAAEKMFDIMLQGRKRECIAVVKTGAEGSIIADGKGICRIGAVPVNAVDSTGAGDAYAAGFLYAHSMGADKVLCGEAGSVLASKVVGTIGPKADGVGLKDANKEIETLLKSKLV